MDIAIDNSSNKTVGVSCYSVHQAEADLQMTTLTMSVSFIANAGVSGHIIKSFGSVTIADSKFSNIVAVLMTSESTPIYWVAILLAQFNFYPRWCK